MTTNSFGRKGAILLSICLLTTLSCYAQHERDAAASCSFGYDTYYNERYNYSVSYPDNMQPLEPAALNDGLKFVSPDERAEFTVWGYFTRIVDPEATIGDEYRYVLENYGDCVTYKRLKGDYYVISGKKDGKIFYMVTKWRGEIGVTADLKYDEQLQDSYGKACAVILKSLEIEDSDILNP